MMEVRQVAQTTPAEEAMTMATETMMTTATTMAPEEVMAQQDDLMVSTWSHPLNWNLNVVI